MLSRLRWNEMSASFASLRIAVVGDYCLDRYFEIDPAKSETSIETGLPVWNVVRVRSQPGGAGTILANLVALGVAEVFPVGYRGEDGEGFELHRAVERLVGDRAFGLLSTSDRHTFTYGKPLVLETAGPRELNRLDVKNWTPTPPDLRERLGDRLTSLAPYLHAIVVLDQVDVAETGVVTRRMLQTLAELAWGYPHLWIVADSRRGLEGFPPSCWKMNRAELERLVGVRERSSLDEVRRRVGELARERNKPTFVTLAEEGIVGASADGAVTYEPALPVRGPIDVVGAGDAVTATLAATLASGATIGEAIAAANAAASVVLHQVGTTGVATPDAVGELLGPS